MAAIRRILLCFWGLLSAAAAVVIAVMLVNSAVAQSIYDFMDKVFLYNMRLSFLENTGIWWAILFGLLLLALGIFCIIISLAPQAAAKKLRVATVDGGSVDISLSALHNVVTKAATGQNGVDSVDARLLVKNNGLHVTLSIKVPDGVSVTDMGSAVREAVKSQLEAIAGIIPADVQVVISDVTEQKEAVANGH